MAVDMEEIKKMLKKREEEKKNNPSNGGNQFQWVTMPEDGEIKIRFLPPVHGASLPGIVVKKHYDIPERGTINCLSQYDMKCPICQVIEKYSDRINVDTWRPSASAYFNVLVRGDKGHEEGVVFLMRSSDFTYFWLLENIMNPDVGDITDEQTGSNVTFKRKSHKGPFERIIARQSVPIADSIEAIEKIMGSAYNLQEIWRTPDTAYTNSVIEFAESLDNEIKRRLLALEASELGKSTAPEAPKTPDTSMSTPSAPPEAPAPSAPPSSPKIEEKPQSAVPAGAPECFAKSHDENDRKCMLCNYEFTCSSASKAA